MPDTRTYIKVHDGMPDHPKIIGLSDAAFRLLVETWCYCSRYLTDGVIPEPYWSRQGSKKARSELLQAKLVEKLPDGSFSMHDYLEHQRSADEVDELRRKRADAGRRGGKEKARRLASAKANARAGAKQTLKQTPSKHVAETDTEEVLRTSNGTAPSKSIDAGTVVKAYVDGAVEAGLDKPTSQLCSKVGRDARRLLTTDHVPGERLVAASKRMGAGGWSSLDTELQRLSADEAKRRPRTMADVVEVESGWNV